MGSSLINAAVAKCVGRSHFATSTPCQDAVAVKLDGAFGCIALADGAGSRKHSDRGAQVCVDAVVRYLRKHFDQLFDLARIQPNIVGERVLKVALLAMRGYVRRKKYDVNDLACTLLFAAYKNGQLLVGHLGDGVIGIQNGADVQVLSLPENGEFANSTYFVTDTDAHSHFRIYSLAFNGNAGVLLMSDGAAESLFNRSTNGLAPAVNRIFEWATKLPSRRLGDVLKQNLEQVFRAKTADDCSIAIVVSR